MKIKRECNWYRPYSLCVNGKSKYIHQIHFYKDGEIICSTLSGWLENKDGGDIEEIDLPVEEIKLKRVLSQKHFDGSVFAMNYKEPYDSETTYDLYIPANMFNVHFVENMLEYHRAVYAIYEGSNGIFIRKYIKCIDDILYAIRNEYEKVYKELSDTSLAIVREDIVMENIDKLKELAMRFFEERKRIHSLTIEDIEL